MARAQSIVACDPPASHSSSIWNPTTSVPDLDFDGTDDVIVSGISDDAGVNGGGVVYCYSGATGSLLYSVTSPSPLQFGAFGTALAGLRDIDHDGAGDFIVGTLFEETAYVFSGKHGILLRTLTSPNKASCGFGQSVAVVPDLDADGADDIAVAAECEFGYGRIHLFSGATGAYLRSLVSPGQGQGTRYFGTYMAGIPDVDGDGAGDIVAGDPYRYRNGNNDPGGAAYVFSGATGALLHTVFNPAPAPDNYYFGERVAGAPDLNADGRGDFLVSGSRLNSTAYSGGRVFVYSGASGQLIRTIDSPFPQQSGRFGYGLHALPDVDGDGQAELLIGAWGETPPGFPSRSGRAYLLSGASGSLLRTFVSPTPNRANANFGTCLAVLADPHTRGAVSLAFSSGDCASVCNPAAPGRVFLFRFCPADWNYDGVTDSRDFFAYILAFFDGRGDSNRDGATDSRDFFDFIAAFLGACGE